MVHKADSSASQRKWELLQIQFLGAMLFKKKKKKE